MAWSDLERSIYECAMAGIPSNCSVEDKKFGQIKQHVNASFLRAILLGLPWVGDEYVEPAVSGSEVEGGSKEPPQAQNYELIRAPLPSTGLHIVNAIIKGKLDLSDGSRTEGPLPQLFLDNCYLLGDWAKIDLQFVADDSEASGKVVYHASQANAEAGPLVNPRIDYFAIDFSRCRINAVYLKNCNATGINFSESEICGPLEIDGLENLAGGQKNSPRNILIDDENYIPFVLSKRRTTRSEYDRVFYNVYERRIGSVSKKRLVELENSPSDDEKTPSENSIQFGAISKQDKLVDDYNDRESLISETSSFSKFVDNSSIMRSEWDVDPVMVCIFNMIGCRIDGSVELRNSVFCSPIDEDEYIGYRIKKPDDYSVSIAETNINGMLSLYNITLYGGLWSCDVCVESSIYFKEMLVQGFSSLDETRNGFKFYKVNCKSSLIIEDCDFFCSINCTDSNFGSVQISNCDSISIEPLANRFLLEIDFSGVRVDRSFKCKNSWFHAQFRLVGAKIGDDLSFLRTHLGSGGREAFVADGIVAGVLAFDTVHSYGKISFEGAALDKCTLEKCRVMGLGAMPQKLKKDLEAEGRRVTLARMTMVAGVLSSFDKDENRPWGDQSAETIFNENRNDLGPDVPGLPRERNDNNTKRSADVESATPYVSKYKYIESGVSAKNLECKSDFILTDTYLIGCLNMQASCIGKDFALLDSGIVDSDFIEKRDILNSIAFTSTSSVVTGEIALNNNIVAGHIYLDNTSCSTLSDSQSGYGNSSGVELKIGGLTYNRLENPDFHLNSNQAHSKHGNFDRRLKWVRDAVRRNGKNPQPYVQLVKALTYMGRTKDALTVRIEKARFDLSQARMAFFGRDFFPPVPVDGPSTLLYPVRAVGRLIGVPSRAASLVLQHLFGACFDFGLNPAKALMTFFACILAGSVLFHFIQLRGAMIVDQQPVAAFVNSKGEGASLRISVDDSDRLGNFWGADVATGPICPDMNPILYSLDVFVPLVDLREESNCRIGESEAFPRPTGQFAKLNNDLNGAAAAVTSIEIKDSKEIEIYNILKVLYAMMGWLVTSLSVVTFSGILQRRYELS